MKRDHGHIVIPSAKREESVRVVPGGHDERWAKPGRAYQTRSGAVQQLPPLVAVNLTGVHFVLCHYPLREWEGSYHGALHLYGHVHGNLEPLAGSLDVGMDVFPAPISLEAVLERLQAQRGSSATL